MQQGDAITSYLFNIAIRVLAFIMLNNYRIKGSVLNKSNFKIFQYANDAIFF